MGQYHIPVNLDKREFISPHKLGAGLKLWEQLANHPGTGAALIVLLGVSNGRGGGDLRRESPVEKGALSPLDLMEMISTLAGAEGKMGKVTDPDRVIGRWGGDRIAIVGDYAEDTDLDPKDHASLIFSLCPYDPTEWERQRTEQVEHWHKLATEEPDNYDYLHARADDLENALPYTDITELVKPILAVELGIKYEGEGEWLSVVRDPDADWSIREKSA